jgi:hypothetical protein
VCSHNIRRVGGVAARDTVQTQVLSVLSDTDTYKDELPSKEIGRRIGRDWRSIVHYVNTPAFSDSAAALGWKYEAHRGCKGSCFKRLSPNQAEDVFQGIAQVASEGVLSAYM